jgi:multidrug resistance efflux pump
MTPEYFSSFEHIYHYRQKSRIRFWSAVFFGVLILILFLPWTQNIRAKGQVTTLKQEQRPQQINTIIAGRVEMWYVKEGDFVKKGDTLVRLSEVKPDYLDPKLLQRTQEQLNAKRQTIEYYQGKITATGGQITALQLGLQAELDQLRNKMQQQRLKVEADSMDMVAARNDLNIATLQYNRAQILLDSGVFTRVQFEQRNQAFQNSRAKAQSTENRFFASRQELVILRIELSQKQQEYTEKMMKAEGDRFGSLSQVATGQGDVAKLENQYASYAIRNGMYYIIAPQSGQIIQARTAGLGEVLKEGDMLVRIVPDQIDYAVEMFVRPVDLPLMGTGQDVRFMFDGFPAIVFSGWPNASYGTYSGKVTAVESDVSENGKFRVLIREDTTFRPWPKELRIGAGANGIALLKTVPVWYELWRNINSFPPDYYKPTNIGGSGKDGKVADKK